MTKIVAARNLRARAILAVVVTAATLLAGAWAFYVPMMQDPDESAHVDYAFSILTAHRISFPTDGTLSTDVHPYTRYLEAATGFRGMRYSSYGRVPKGYGSRAFFARVDAGAPRVTPASSSARALPVYAGSYPFGFYAVEASVMALAGLVYPGSLVAAFFAARLFCVALLVPTLLCTYGIFRYLRLSRGLALTLTGSVAFFPLTSSTFSYVQPDNLVAALVAAALLAALHLRDCPSVRTAVTVGALLAALALTKYHDALVLLSVITFMAVTRARARAKLAYVIIPPLAAFSIAAAATSLTPTKHHLLCTTFGAAVHAALRAGPAAFVFYVASTGTNFFARTLVGGWPFVEYWDAVGWIPHRFILLTQPVTDAVIATLGFVTVAMVIILLMRVVAIVARLASLARVRGFATVTRILSGDIALNAYLAYFAFMLVANVYSGNQLQHGRYWLPFAFGALLCAVRYVPHFVSRRFERPLATTLATVLAAYSVVAAWPALDVVNRSYYVPRASTPYVEPFANFDRSTLRRFAAERLTRGITIVVSGYAVDGPSESVARGASLLMDGRSRILLRYGNERGDVVCTFNDVSLARSGFRGSFTTTGLAPGRHSLELQVAESEFPNPVRTASRISFIIGSSSAAGALHDRRRDRFESY